MGRVDINSNIETVIKYLTILRLFKYDEMFLLLTMHSFFIIVEYYIRLYILWFPCIVFFFCYNLLFMQ